METWHVFTGKEDVAYLGNFLVEWKPATGGPLSTNTVFPWKLPSGMETEGPSISAPFRYRPWKLPSGMETLRRGQDGRWRADLGNFLVEWKLPVC